MTSFVSWSIAIILILNMFLALALIFLERRDPAATWAWLLVLFFIPVLGFIIYLLLGRRLRKKHLFRWKDQNKIGIEQLIEEQVEELSCGECDFKKPEVRKYEDMIYMHLVNNHAVLTQDNDMTIFDDGKEKFDALKEDLRQAKDHIHFQYYILRLDHLGQEILDILIDKAKEGVKVRILFDDIGSRGVRKRDFKELMKYGGEVGVFFPAVFPLINPRLNYRNHRKIVVIDGNIGYIGGFNVGDEYLGLAKKFGYWRDTHLRITGSAVLPLQTRFIMDWTQAEEHNQIPYKERYFPLPTKPKGDVAMQIVSSGPDSEWEQIKDGYLKMINRAKKYIYIQTPYFIPDVSFLDAVRIATLSGVDVRIMIPNKPDHMFVYWATYSNVGKLLKAGARVFIYENGFIHAKQIVVDDEVSTVGTANIDFRSFKLNFEVNAFIYDYEQSKKLAQLFHEDMEKSSELTYEMYLNRSNVIKMKESISRLLSPIL